MAYICFVFLDVKLYDHNTGHFITYHVKWWRKNKDQQKAPWLRAMTEYGLGQVDG